MKGRGGEGRGEVMEEWGRRGVKGEVKGRRGP